jgi:hypothetical protein
MNQRIKPLRRTGSRPMMLNALRSRGELVESIAADHARQLAMTFVSKPWPQRYQDNPRLFKPILSEHN